MVTRPATTIHSIHPAKGSPVFYEDEIVDGRVPIEMMQSNAIKGASAALDHIFDPDESAYMDSNLPIRLDPDDLRVSIAPDFYRSRNVNVASIRDQTGYNLWEVGKPPEWVLEVASRSTYERDLYEKPEIYAAIGVSELWMFDPTGGELYGEALMGFTLVEGRYERIETVPNEHGLMSGYSEELGLRLCAMEWSKREKLLGIQPSLSHVLSENHQPWQLLFQDAGTGEYVLNVIALKVEYERAEAERDAAQAERDAAEAERDAAQAEYERAEAERDAAQAERDAAEAERDAAQAERDAAEAERDAAQAENARLREQIQRMNRN